MCAVIPRYEFSRVPHPACPPSASVPFPSRRPVDDNSDEFKCPTRTCKIWKHNFEEHRNSEGNSCMGLCARLQDGNHGNVLHRHDSKKTTWPLHLQAKESHLKSLQSLGPLALRFLNMFWIFLNCWRLGLCWAAAAVADIDLQNRRCRSDAKCR